MSTTNENVTLYKFETLESDGFNRVDWIWVEDGEIANYLSSGTIYREATEEEVYLYEEAFSYGKMLGTVETSYLNHNGVMFRVDGLGGVDPLESMKTVKIFTCARCDKEKEFDSNVATVNELYLTELKDDVLWHVCYDCVVLQTDIESIEFDFGQEGEATS